MSDDDSDERLAEWVAGYAAGFAAGCDTSRLGRLYRQVLQERDAAERAAQLLDRRLQAVQGRITAPPGRGRIANDTANRPAPRCCASDPGGALFEDS